MPSTFVWRPLAISEIPYSERIKQCACSVEDNLDQLTSRGLDDGWDDDDRLSAACHVAATAMEGAVNEAFQQSRFDDANRSDLIDFIAGEVADRCRRMMSARVGRLLRDEA